MTMQDPIADMLIRLRNAQKSGHPSVAMPSSKIKVAICEVLAEEGYIDSYAVSNDAPKSLVVQLRYHHERGVIDSLKRVSRCGLRVYRGAKELPKVMGGLGIAIVSTPKGVMSDRKARAEGLGGEVLCYVA